MATSNLASSSYSVSLHKSRSFCRFYYVAIGTVTHVKHGARNKVTFVLSNDRIVVTLLVNLAIDLKQLRKVVIYRKLRTHTFSIGISQPKVAQ